MPEKETLEKAEQDKREGKAPSTQAGEFEGSTRPRRRGPQGAAWTRARQAR